jgi:TonB family protein
MMKQRITRGLLLLVIFAQALHAQTADDPGSVEAKLKSIYVGNLVTLRGFYSDSVLNYDADGSLTSKSSSGPWTLDGKVRVDSVNLKGGNERLVFGCTRVAVGAGKDGALQNFITAEKVDLNIKVNSPFNASQVYHALAGVMMKKGESMADLVPDYWKAYFGGQAPDPVSGAPAMPKKTRVRISSGVAQGNLVKQVRPEYPAIAKFYKQSGVVIMRAVIGVDGTLTALSVVHPAGMGLDEAAIDAVKQWRYNPYLLNGVPVEVETQITVNFNIGR